MEGHLTPPHEPVDHPSLQRLPDAEPRTIFDEIRKGDILFLLGLLGAVAFVYVPGLQGPPVYDDGTGVLRNPVMGNLRGLPGRFLDPVPPQPPGVPLPSYAYRPFTEASFALQQALGASLPALRLGNLLLHAAASFLVFLIVNASHPSSAGSLSPLGRPPLRPPPLAVGRHLVYQRAVSWNLLSFLSLLLYLAAGPSPPAPAPTGPPSPRASSRDSQGARRHPPLTLAALSGSSAGPAPLAPLLAR